MSAVRMVAYGVLELKHKDGAPWLNLSDDELSEEREEDRKRDELRKLVGDELERYGLLIQRVVTPRGKLFRARDNTYILYGQHKGTTGFNYREVILEGDFKECCVEAAKLLDAMNATQLPDTAAGLDQR